MTGHMQPVNHVAFSPDGSMIASASFDKSVKIWDGRTGLGRRVVVVVVVVVQLVVVVVVVMMMNWMMLQDHAPHIPIPTLQVNFSAAALDMSARCIRSPLSR
jgi:hypothetical protein